METAEATEASSIASQFIPLNNLPDGDWRTVLEGNNIDPAVLALDYSPGSGIMSNVWGPTVFCRERRIRPPVFSPTCFGCPLLWNSGDSGTEFEGYKVCYGWGRKLDKWYPSKTDIEPSDERELLYHLRDFLAVRPLSRDLDRFIPVWKLQRNEEAELSKPVLQPEDDEVPEFIVEQGARRCADLFRWDSVQPFKSGGYTGFRVPYKCGGKIVHGTIDGATTEPGWEVGYHATSAYCLYSQCYHNKLKESAGDVPGERAVTGSDGVYLFDIKHLSSCFQYSMGTTLGWHGVVYHFLWEIQYRKPSTRKAGASKNQTVCDSKDIKFANLIVIPMRNKQLNSSNGLYYLRPPICEKNVWCPCYEGNPLDAFSGLCSKDHITRPNPFAVKLAKSFSKSAWSGGASTNTGEASSSSKSKKAREWNPMRVAIDSSSMTQLMIDAAKCDVEQVVGLITQMDAAWRTYAIKVVNLLAATYDVERKNVMLSGVPQVKHPLIAMLHLMRDIGDHNMADKLLADYKAGIMPPDRAYDLSEGCLVISGDSVISLRKTNTSRIPEPEIRAKFGKNFTSWKYEGKETFEKDNWRILIEQPQEKTIYFVHCALQLFDSVKTIMDNTKTYQTIDGVALPPGENAARPRIGILFWTINEGMGVNFDEDHQVWTTINVWAREHAKYLDRVGVIIMGSAESWSIEPMWDQWLEHAQDILKRNSIPVFDGSSVVHKMVRDEGFHFQSTDASKEGIATITLQVCRYLIASLSRFPDSYNSSLDEYDQGGKGWRSVDKLGREVVIDRSVIPETQEEVEGDKQTTSVSVTDTVESSKPPTYSPEMDPLASSADSERIYISGSITASVASPAESVLETSKDLEKPKEVIIPKKSIEKTEVVEATKPHVMSEGDLKARFQELMAGADIIPAASSSSSGSSGAGVVAAKATNPVRPSIGSSGQSAKAKQPIRSQITLTGPMNVSRPPEPSVPPTKGKGKAPKGVSCHRCGENHFIRDCPHHPACFICGKTDGHMASTCPDRNVKGKGKGKKGKSKLSADELRNVAAAQFPVQMRGSAGVASVAPTRPEENDDPVVGPETDAQGWTIKYHVAVSFVRSRNIIEAKKMPYCVLDADKAVANVKAAANRDKQRTQRKITVEKMKQLYGMGFSLLDKTGFDGRGLGANRDGIENPIFVASQMGKEGIRTSGETKTYPEFEKMMRAIDPSWTPTVGVDEHGATTVIDATIEVDEETFNKLGLGAGKDEAIGSTDDDDLSGIVEETSVPSASTLLEHGKVNIIVDPEELHWPLPFPFGVTYEYLVLNTNLDEDEVAPLFILRDDQGNPVTDGSDPFAPEKILKEGRNIFLLKKSHIVQAPESMQVVPVEVKSVTSPVEVANITSADELLVEKLESLTVAHETPEMKSVERTASSGSTDTVVHHMPRIMEQEPEGEQGEAKTTPRSGSYADYLNELHEVMKKYGIFTQEDARTIGEKHEEFKKLNAKSADIIRVIAYHEIVSCFDDMEEYLVMETFLVLYESYEKSLAGTVSKPFDLVKLVMDWLESEGVVVGEIKAENPLVIAKTKSINELLKDMYSQVTVDQVVKAILARREHTEKNPNDYVSVIDMLVKMEFTKPLELNQRQLEAMWHMFVKEDTTRVVEFADYVKAHKEATQGIRAGRRPDIRFILEREGVITHTDVPLMDRNKMYSEFKGAHSDLEISKVNFFKAHEEHKRRSAVSKIPFDVSAIALMNNWARSLGKKVDESVDQHKSASAERVHVPATSSSSSSSSSTDIRKNVSSTKVMNDGTVECVSDEGVKRIFKDDIEYKAWVEQQLKNDLGMSDSRGARKPPSSAEQLEAVQPSTVVTETSKVAETAPSSQQCHDVTPEKERASVTQDVINPKKGKGKGKGKGKTSHIHELPTPPAPPKGSQLAKAIPSGPVARALPTPPPPPAVAKPVETPVVPKPDVTPSMPGHVRHGVPPPPPVATHEAKASVPFHVAHRMPAPPPPPDRVVEEHITHGVPKPPARPNIFGVPEPPPVVPKPLQAQYEFIQREPRTAPQMTWEADDQGVFRQVPWTVNSGKIHVQGTNTWIPAPPRLLAPIPKAKPKAEAVAPPKAVEGKAKAKSKKSKAKKRRVEDEAAETADPRLGGTTESGAAVEAPRGQRREAGDRSANIRDLERPPLNKEERDQLKADFLRDSRQHISKVNATFPSMENWKLTYIETERIAHIDHASRTQGGHVASVADIDAHRDKNTPVHERMIRLVLDLLRHKRYSLSKFNVAHVFEMTNEAWVPCRDIIEAVRQEVTGSQFSLARLLAVVFNDEFRRMQLWITDEDRTREIVLNDFTHVRAISGHDESFGVDYRLVYPPREKFDPKSVAAMYRGPDYVFYYTDTFGFNEVWKQNGITPSCCRFGVSSKKFIFCTPVDINHPDCPGACLADVGKIRFQFTLNFQLMLRDGIEASYTYEGLVAVKAEAIGAAYIAQIISTETGAYAYLRNFKIDDDILSEPTNVRNPLDTRNERNISCEKCFVCNSDVWVGTITCMHCMSPVITEDHGESGFPRFDRLCCSIEDRFMGEWSADEKKDFKQLISIGRRMNGKRFNAFYGIRAAGRDEEVNRSGEGRRSFRQQAGRAENKTLRQHEMEVRRGYTTFTGTLEDRIRRDAIYRLKLARGVVNCAQHYTPAMVLMNKYHRLAYKTAIELGEITYESVGHRDRDLNVTNVDMMQP